MALNPSHLMATGGATAMLADVYMYLSHWPLQPLTGQQATDFAGLTVLALGLLSAARQRPSTGSGNGGAPSSADQATISNQK